MAFSLITLILETVGSLLKKTWLRIQSEPLKSHKVHFLSGKKSFGALPTVVKISCRQTVNSRQTVTIFYNPLALMHKSQPMKN
jgi:hypothetical protein